MKFLDLTFDEPAANLACDEALLEMMEADVSRASGDDCLRIWQARQYFVVAGHSDGLRSNVNVAACNERRIPILRRMSGGGTVVQGPGCVSYSLILKTSARLKNIADTFKHVLERHRSVVQKVCGMATRVEGISDLAYDGFKFSGNAQYRKARFVLVHGTFLLNFDLSLIEALLPVPAKQPGYRRSRSHLEFVANLRIDANQLTDALRTVWACEEDFRDVPYARIIELVRDRYGSTGWSEKF
jgi:lipoate---protein ligase